MSSLTKLTVHGLEGSPNDGRAVKKLLLEYGTLRAGLRLTAPGVEVIVSACSPEQGRCIESSEITLATQVLKVFRKVHVLPYKDTFKYNYDHMYNQHIVPYFNSAQNGEFTAGVDFAYKGARFQVIAVEPNGTYGVVGDSTELFYEGAPLERNCLKKLHVLPFEDGLPEKYHVAKFKLDDEALKRDYLSGYFAQNSAEVAPGQTFEIRGVKFKVVSCVPAKGAGFADDTELLCQGIALKEHLPKHVSKAKSKGSAKGSGKGGYPGAAASGGAEGNSQGGGGECVIS